MTEQTAASLPLLEADLVRTFVAISETGSFTRAARQGLRTPSAVSMQVKRLEDALGRQLFVRDGRQVHLTPDGERLLGYSRRLLSLNQETVAAFVRPELAGKVRLGAPDDFGTRFVPNILSRFATTHPMVEVDVVLAPSLSLLARLDAGGLDLTLATCGREQHGQGGTLVHVEPLAWAGLKGGVAHEAAPLPLALSSRGCNWRAMAMGALDRAGLRYRVAYCSEHCQGQLAAVLADLAIAPLPESLISGRIRRLGATEGLPPIGDFHVFLHHRAQPHALAGPTPDPVIDALARHVTESFGASPETMDGLPMTEGAARMAASAATDGD